jgi:hypothetical protein
MGVTMAFDSNGPERVVHVLDINGNMPLCRDDDLEAEEVIGALDFSCMPAPTELEPRRNGILICPACRAEGLRVETGFGVPPGQSAVLVYQLERAHRARKLRFPTAEHAHGFVLESLLLDGKEQFTMPDVPADVFCMPIDARVYLDTVAPNKEVELSVRNIGPEPKRFVMYFDEC